MDIVARAKGLLTRSREERTIVAGEPSSAAGLFTGHVVSVSLLGRHHLHILYSGTPVLAGVPGDETALLTPTLTGRGAPLNFVVGFVASPLLVF